MQSVQQRTSKDDIDLQRLSRQRLPKSMMHHCYEQKSRQNVEG
jgi:hypothetical protein